MNFIFNFFLLAYGNEMKFFPDSGVLFMKEPVTGAVFVDKNQKLTLNFKYHLPEFKNLKISERTCPGVFPKFSQKRNVDAFTRNFFHSRLLAEIFGSGNILESERQNLTDGRGVKFITNSPDLRRVREVNRALVVDSERDQTNTTTDEGAISTSHSWSTTIIPENMTQEPTDINLIFGEKFNMKFFDVKAKMYIGSLSDILESNKEFRFRCYPKSSNGKIYRSFELETQTPVSRIELKTTQEVVNLGLEHSYLLLLRVTSPDHGNSSFSEICKNRSVRDSEKLSFECSDQKTDKNHRYVLNIGFENERSCEEATFSDLKLTKFSDPNALKRSTRQFGEILIPLGIGSLLGLSASHWASSDPNSAERAAEQKEIMQLGDSFNTLTTEFTKVEHEFNSEFQHMFREICLMENLETTQRFESLLNRHFSDYLNGLEMLIIKSNIRMEGSAVLKELAQICQKVNKEFAGSAIQLCTHYYEIQDKFEIMRIIVPRLGSTDEVGVILEIESFMPTFRWQSDVFTSFQVPVPVSPVSGNKFSYKFVENVPKVFGVLEKPVGPSKYFPLDTCEYQHDFYFCERDTLNQIFTRNSICLNTLLAGVPDCKIDTFTVEIDCYFREVNSKLLLLSNSGNAILRVARADGLSHGLGKTVDQVSLIHNITEISSINCKTSSFTFTQPVNNFTIDVFPSVFSKKFDTFSEIEDKIDNELNKTVPILQFSTPKLHFTTVKPKTSEKIFAWLKTLGGWKYVIYIGGSIFALIFCTFIIMTCFAGIRTLIISIFSCLWRKARGLTSPLTSRYRVGNRAGVELGSVRRDRPATPV